MIRVALALVVVVSVARADDIVVTKVPAVADRFHDPLPPHAIARFGTPRLYHGALVEGLGVVGTTIATVGDGIGHHGPTIRFWDLRDGRLVAHATVANVHQTDAGGGKLVVSNIESALLIDGLTVRVLLRHGANELIKAVAIDSDGKAAAVVTAAPWSTPCRVHVYQLDNPRGRSESDPLHVGPGEHVTPCDLAEPRHAALDPSGLVALGDEHGTLVVIDTHTDKVVMRHAMTAHDAPALRFAPKSHDLFEARDSVLVRWNVRAGRALYEKPDAFNGAAQAVAVSSDEASVAIAAYDIALADGQTGAVRWHADLGGSTGPSYAIAFVGDRVIAGSNEGGLRLLEAKTGARAQIVPDETVEALAFQTADRLLVLGEKLYAYSIAAPAKPPATLLDKDPPRAIAVTPQALFTMDNKKTLRRLRLPGLEQTAALAGRDGWLHALAPDGAYLYTTEFGAFDRVATAKLKLAPVAQQPKEVECVAPGVSGAFAVVAQVHGHRTLLRWSKAGAPSSVELAKVDAPTSCVAVGDDVVLATYDRLVVVRKSGKVELLPKQQPMWKIAADPKHARVAFAGADDSVGLYDLASGKRVDLGRHEGRIDALAFSPDGTLLATGGLDQSVLVWDVR